MKYLAVHSKQLANEEEEVANGIMKTYTLADAISTLRLYISEALDFMGPTLLEREYESGFQETIRL